MKWLLLNRKSGVFSLVSMFFATMNTIVSISKEWMTWGDSYELDITNPEDEIVALAVVLTIDCVTEASTNASATISNN